MLPIRVEQMTAPTTGWFYVITEEAAPVLKKIFEKGVRPGAVITISAEDFETLTECLVPLPVTMVDSARIVGVPPGIPRAS